MAAPVLMLCGSAESEFFAELSRTYAAGCLAMLAADERWEPHVAWVEPDRSWRFPAGTEREEVDSAPALSLAAALDRIEAIGPAAMVPQMFCRAGMTTYRALFDLLGIPYPGSGPATMALAADKPQARALVAAAGVCVPAGEVVQRGAEPALEPPVVVKPVAADNSTGVTLVRERGEYAAAIERAGEAGDEVLVERYVELGREVRCGVLARGGELLALPVEEYAVDAARKPIRTYADKLAPSADGGLDLVAKSVERAWIVDADDPVCAAVGAAARRCQAALGARDYGLFDFRIDPEGRPWFLEASLYCSFSPGSVIATMAAAAGIELAELFAVALASAGVPPPPSRQPAMRGTPDGIREP